MPLQNRVLPTGEFAADPARGLFMGNRGRLHAPDRSLGRRRWATPAWIACVLCFRGRQRQVWGNSYTELFFLDEAVAFAAGHRPCAECRRADFRRFQQGWRLAGLGDASAPSMNARMHADRIEPRTRAQRRYRAALADLPDGCFVIDDGGRAGLLSRGMLWPFSPAGYGAPRSLPDSALVLTPRCVVDVLRAGYRPVVHGSAEREG